DALGQTGQALVFRVDPILQPPAQLLLPVVAGLDRQLMLAERFGTPAVEALELRLVQRRGVPCGIGLIAQLLRRFPLALDASASAQCLAVPAFGFVQPVSYGF